MSKSQIIIECELDIQSFQVINKIISFILQHKPDYFLHENALAGYNESEGCYYVMLENSFIGFTCVSMGQDVCITYHDEISNEIMDFFDFDEAFRSHEIYQTARLKEDDDSFSEFTRNKNNI